MTATSTSSTASHRARLPAGPLQPVLAALAYLGLAVLVTWPMPAHMGTAIFGTGGDDNWALLAQYRELVQHGLNPFLPGKVPDLAAPEGLEVPYALNLVQWGSVGMQYVLTAAFGAVAGLNVLVLLGFVLDGTAMFLLVRHLTGHAGAAFVAGVAFAFFPRNVVWAQNHQYFMHSWVLVLLAWRMLALSEAPSPRNGVFAGLAAVLALSWNAYYILFAAVVYLAFLLWDAGRLALRRAGRGLVLAHAVSGAVVLAALAAYAAVAVSAPGAQTESRSIAEAYVYSGRLPEYVLPDDRHPVFGSLTRKYLSTHLHGSGYGEINNYLGLTVLALALVALIAAFRGRIPVPGRHRVWLFAGIAVLGLLFSAPPTADIGPIRLYFPAWAIFEVTSTWRLFVRVFVVIGLGVSVLAGYGLARLLAGRPPRLQWIAVPLVAALVAFDLWVEPTQEAAGLPRPAVYQALEQEPPDGVVAEYPLLPDDIPVYDSRLNQQLHGRPVLNGYVGGSEQEARALALSRLDETATAGRLALLGVRWIVVDERPPPRPDVAPAGTPGLGFTLRERRDGFALYEVSAPPASSWVSPGEGFGGPEGKPDDRFYWLTKAEGSLEVRARCRPCDGEVVFEALSFHVPRRLVVRDPEGRVVASVKVPPAGTTVRVPVRFTGSEDLKLEADPGPLNVRETTGGPDLRDLSILVHEPRYVRR